MIAAEKFHADCSEFRAVAADEGADAVAGGAEMLAEVAADESGGTGDEETGFGHGRRIRGADGRNEARRGYRMTSVNGGVTAWRTKSREASGTTRVVF